MLCKENLLHSRFSGEGINSHRRMEPISHWVNAKIQVVVLSCRSVNDDATQDTVTVLDRVMAVVP